jgi:hypothetical protein
MRPKYKQGIYKPINPTKFIGNTATYRSGLELRFFRFCDYNPNILKWSSESIVVPYISPLDNKVHRYFVDNFVVVKEGKAIKKYLVEIKPYKQTIPPSTKYRKQSHLLYEQAAWTVNQAKWSSAREYCKKHGFDFLILTEKELITK